MMGVENMVKVYDDSYCLQLLLKLNLLFISKFVNNL